jgi:drug/metabolite transporter (DMT)-like permease
MAMGIAVTVTYGLVQLAFRLAPVGYVTALRESSVVIAALVGTRMLGEPAGRRRVTASVIVLAGLVLLVLSQR